jgi:parallel beta-helix repeat protein
MFSSLVSLLDSFGIAKHVQRRALSIFSRPPRWTRRREYAGAGLGVVSLTGIEPLEMKSLFAVDIDLVGTVLTVAFDDAAADSVSLSINATGYVATGANTSSGSGTITELVVIDAGTKNTSNFTLLDASQTLSDGLSVGANITTANLATAINASGDAVLIEATSITLGGNVTAGGQAYYAPVTLAADVTLTSTGASEFVTDYANVSIVGDAVGEFYAQAVTLSADGRYAFVADYNGGLEIFDVSDAANATLVGSKALTGQSSGVTLSSNGQYAFVAGGYAGLQIIGVSNVANPTVVGSYNTSGFASEVAISSSGKFAFVADGDSGLQIINITNPASPTLAGSFNTNGSALGVALSASGAYAFVADGKSGLQIISVSNVAAPSRVGGIDTLGQAEGVSISADGNVAFVADGFGQGLQIFNVSNVANPTLAGNFATSGYSYGVTLSSDGQHAFLADGFGGLKIIDVSNVADPTLSGEVDTGCGTRGVALSPDGQFAFLADGSTGLLTAQLGTFENTPGIIGFLGTVDGPFALTVNDGPDGETFFLDEVGGQTPLTRLTTDAGGTVNLGGNVTTTGNQSYGDLVNLAVATVLTGTSGSFAGGVDGNANDLTLDFTATTAIAGGFDEINNLTVTGDATLCGNITTTGEQDYQGDVELLCNTTLTSGGSVFVPDYANPSLAGNLDTSGRAIGVALSSSGQYAFVGDYTSGLQIIDVSNVANPSLVGNIVTSGRAYQVTLSSNGQYAFVANGDDGLQIIDVSNVAAPFLTGSFATDGPAYFLTLSSDGRYAFVTDADYGLQIIDVSDVADPSLVGYLDTSGYAYGVTLSSNGRYAFVADYVDGLQIIDVSNVANPSLVGNLDTISNAVGVSLSSNGQYAFVADLDYGLQIIDVSNVASPFLVGNLDTNGSAYGVTLSSNGQYVFVADIDSGLQIIDVSNVASPFLVGNLDTSGSAYSVSLSSDGGYAFVADGDSGLQIVMLGSLEPIGGTVSFGGTVDGGYSLTINDGDNGTTTFTGEVGGTTPLGALTTDANGTVELGANVTTTGNQSFGDVVNLTGSTVLTGGTGTFVGGVTGNNNDLTLNFTGRAQINEGFTGIGNLTSAGDATLCGNITTTGAQDYQADVELLCNTTLTASSLVFVADYANPSFAGALNTPGSARNVTLSSDGRFAFVADRNAGLQIIDVSSAAVPTFAGNLDTPGNAFGVVLSADGRYAFVADGSSGLQIIDVSNVALPTLAGNLDTPGDARNVTLSSDGLYAFVADGSSGLQIIDISNVALPTFVGNLDTPATAYGVVLSADGLYAFVADGSAGLQIIDVSNVALPTFVGNLNTPGIAYGVSLSTDGRYAFIGDGYLGGLQIIDVTDVALPTFAGSLDTPGVAYGVTLSSDGGYAFVADSGFGIQIIDVSNIALPAFASDFNTPGVAYGVTLSSNGQFAFVADGGSGLQIVSLGSMEPLGPGTVAFGGTVDGGYSLTINDGENGTTAFAGVVGGETPLTALTTDANGTAFLAANVTVAGPSTFGDDVILTGNVTLTSTGGSRWVSDYANPTLITNVSTTQSARNVVLSPDEQYAFVSASTAGLVIVDVSDPSNLTVVSTTNPGRVMQTSLSSDGQLAYIANIFPYSMPVLNVADPSSPSTVGNVSFGGSLAPYATAVSPDDSLVYVGLSTGPAGVFRVIDANTLSEFASLNLTGSAEDIKLSADGRYAFVASGYAGLTVINLTGGTPTVESVTDTRNYASAVALTPDGAYAFTADKYYGVQVIDLSNLASPFVVTDINTTGNAFGVTVSADGRYLFVADDYAGGLQILDIADPTAPVPVGSLDTPGDTYATALTADGRYAFVADGVAGGLLSVALGYELPGTSAVTFRGKVDGGYSLTINDGANGTTTFSGEVGGATPLAALTTDANGTVELGANVTTTGNQSFGDVVNLTGSTVLTGGTGTFVGGVDGNTNDLTLDFTATTAIAGGFDEINNLTVTGNATLCGNITTTGAQDYQGDVELLCDTTLTSGGPNAGAISFASTVDGRYSLTVNDIGNGTTVFNDAVGATAPLTRLTTNANGTTTLGANVTVAGPIDFGDDVTLTGAVTVASNTAIFGGTVDGSYALAVNDNANGTTTFAGEVGGATPLASLTTNANGTTSLGGNVTTTGNQSYGDTVRLLGNTTLLSGAGGIATAGITDGGEGYDLTVGDANQTGDVVFGGNLAVATLTAAASNFDVALSGANNSLGSANFTNSGNLTLGASASSRTYAAGGLSAPGVATTFLAGNVVTDSALITLNATSLTANAVLDSTNGGASNGAAILLANGTQLNGFRLETSGGQSDTEVTGDTVISDGELIVETGSLNLGTPGQAGTLTANQDTLIQVSNGALNVFAGSTIAAGANNLTLRLDDLHVEAGAGNITAGSITVTPATAGRTILLGSATGTGLAVNQNAFDAFQTPVITIGGGGYNGTVDVGNLAVPQGRLDIIANGTGGTVLFEGDFVSTATNLPGGIAVYVQGSGATTTLNGSLTTAGAVVIDDAVVTDGSHTIDTSSTNANITITGGAAGIYGAANQTNSLALNAGNGTVILGNQTGFGDNAGNGSLLENVTISAGTTLLGSATSEINGTLSVLTGTLALDGNFTAGEINVASVAGTTLAGNASLVADGNIAFAGTIEGPFALALATNATTTLSAPVGDSTPLAELAITGGTTSLGGDVTTIGNQSYATDLVLDGPTVLTGGFGSFTGALDGNGNSLVLDFANETAIGAGGSFNNLTDLTSLGDVAMNGTVETTGEQNYLGNLSLTGATTIAASDLSLGNGVTGNNQDLTLDIAATMPINGSLSGIGDLTSFGNVTLDGTISTAGFQNYAAAAMLSADTTLNATGNIDFGSLVDGARQLNIQSGGNVNLFAALGSTTPLQALNLASAAAVTALGTLAIDGTGGAAAGLRIGDGVDNVNIAQVGSTITNAALSGLLLAGNSTGSTLGGFTITNSGSHGIEAAGGDYTGTTIENSSLTASGGDGFHAANATGLTGTLLHSAANAKAGVRVAGTSSNVTISDSLVGLDANGTAAQPNLGQGIVVSGATDTTIEANTISGNAFYGVVVNGAANGTAVTGNRIGVGTDGTTAIGNGQSGVFVLAGSTGTTIVGNQIKNNNGMAGIQVVDGTSNTTIGGRAGDSNLLVGNGLFGITVSGNVPGTRVLGNLISSHTTANLYLNNAQNLTVGSATAGEENTFDGSDYGVYAGGDLTGTTIEGNTFQQHTLGGMVLTEAGNLTVSGNTLDDNGAYGIYGTGNLTGTVLQGNTISNHTVGVLVDNGANLTIGSATGTATSDPDANVITKNSSAGIVVNGAGSQNVSILSNSIFENDFIGISLSAGGNALARTPTLASASTTAVTGSITGTDGDVYRIQYFKSSADVTSSSRFAQGEELLGYEDVTIAGGRAALDFDLTGSGVIVTDWITATATLLVGGLPSETSQFSFGIRVTA